MKVLGISMGRKNERSDIYCKQVLMGVEAAAKAAGKDVEVEFINTVTMNIGQCRGCGACSKAPDGKIKCVIKDDYLALEEKVLDADGIVISAPVYSVGIVGQLKNFLDRFGAAHDRASMIDDQEKRRAEGRPLLDERYFKDRYCSYVAVGGAWTEDWTCMGLPMMHLFSCSQAMKVVGQINANDQGRKTSPFLDQPMMDDMFAMGENLCNNLGVPYDETTWFGKEGTCPVCHLNLLMVDGSANVTCPVCGIHGTAAIENGKMNITFPESEQKRARNTINGLNEHHAEIGEMMRICIPIIMEKKEFLDAKKKEYAAYKPTWN
ncbi:MAG: flavodoxin family protein [Eubacteriales bacterium]|nr:flavodoxin family protein [Eubacteriales bacterium]